MLEINVSACQGDAARVLELLAQGAHVDSEVEGDQIQRCCADADWSFVASSIMQIFHAGPEDYLESNLFFYDWLFDGYDDDLIIPAPPYFVDLTSKCTPIFALALRGPFLTGSKHASPMLSLLLQNNANFNLRLNFKLNFGSNRAHDGKYQTADATLKLIDFYMLMREHDLLEMLFNDTRVVTNLCANSSLSTKDIMFTHNKLIANELADDNYYGSGNSSDRSFPNGPINSFDLAMLCGGFSTLKILLQFAARTLSQDLSGLQDSCDPDEQRVAEFWGDIIEHAIRAGNSKAAVHGWLINNSVIRSCVSYEHKQSLKFLLSLLSHDELVTLYKDEFYAVDPANKCFALLNEFRPQRPAAIIDIPKPVIFRAPTADLIPVQQPSHERVDKIAVTTCCCIIA